MKFKHISICRTLLVFIISMWSFSVVALTFNSSNPLDGPSTWGSACFANGSLDGTQYCNPTGYPASEAGSFLFAGKTSGGGNVTSVVSDNGYWLTAGNSIQTTIVNTRHIAALNYLTGSPTMYLSAMTVYQTSGSTQTVRIQTFSNTDAYSHTFGTSNANITSTTDYAIPSGVPTVVPIASIGIPGSGSFWVGFPTSIVFGINTLQLAATDSSAPNFENSTPVISNLASTSLTLNTDLDEDGIVYYVLLADGATAPSVAEVKAGTGDGGAAAIDFDSGSTTATVKNFNITGLTASTGYDIYIVAEDDETTPNVQASVSLVNVTTVTPDTTAPTIVSITRQTPATSSTDADTVTWRVTFDEDVQGVDATDFTISGTTATLGIIAQSASVYDVTASNGDLANLNATITMGVSGSQNITDTALTPNALSNTTPTGTNDNTFDIINDTTAPTVTISAANSDGSLASGSTTNDEALSIAFTISESSNNFTIGDITVGNGSLSTFNGSGKNYTAILKPSSAGLVTIDVASATFTDAVNNDNAAAVQFEWTYGTDPTQKEDVKGTVEAASNIAINFVHSNLHSVNTRFQWLRNNKNTDNKSHQGVNITFVNPFVNEFFNGTSQGFGSLTKENVTSLAKQTGMNAGDMIANAQGKLIKTTAGEMREQLGVNLNPTSGTVLGDWSIWTEGSISLGKVDKTSTSAKQESDSFAITVGVDRPYWGDSVIGLAVTVGKDDVDIGSVGSGIESDNYALRLYSGFEVKDTIPMEVTLGVAHLNMDNKRIDGHQILKSDRDASAVMGSVKAYQADFSRGNFTVTPYGQLELAYIDLDGYSESGGLLALSFEKQHIKHGMVFIGADFNYAANIGASRLRPFGAIEYGYNFTSDSDADMHYIGDTTNYRLKVERAATSNLMARIGTEYDIGDDLTASFSYERTEAIGTGHTDTFKAGLSINF